MPPVQIPLVKPQTGTNIFVCPRCGLKCSTHTAFTEHFVAQHVPPMTGPARGVDALER
jgi:uncharacterized C2H2 Zn-finger protein